MTTAHIAPNDSPMEAHPKSIQIDRASLLAVHPLLSSTDLLPTEPVVELCALVRKIVLLRTSGCYVTAPSGTGKSSALQLIAEFLRREFRGLVVLTHVALNQQVPSIRAFFKHFLVTVRHKETKGETYDLRDRVLRRLIDLARTSPYPVVVLLFDEAQVLKLADFFFLKDIRNELAKNGVQLVTLLMGQAPEFDDVLKLFLQAPRTDIRDRFVRVPLTLRAFMTLDDLGKLLGEVDRAVFPPNSGCSWTGFFFPSAVANGFRLESHAKHLRDALRAASPQPKQSDQFSARHTFETLRSFCLENARFDAPVPTIPVGAWRAASDWAALANATQANATAGKFAAEQGGTKDDKR